MNSGRIFTEPRSGEVNILPLFTEIEKNNCFSIYTGSDLNNIFRRKPLKIDSETLEKREFTPAILFLFGLRIIHSVGGEYCSLARDSEPIRLLKTPRSLSVYILMKVIRKSRRQILSSGHSWYEAVGGFFFCISYTPTELSRACRAKACRDLSLVVQTYATLLVFGRNSKFLEPNRIHRKS